MDWTLTTMVDGCIGEVVYCYNMYERNSCAAYSGCLWQDYDPGNPDYGGYCTTGTNGRVTSDGGVCAGEWGRHQQVLIDAEAASKVQLVFTNISAAAAEAAVIVEDLPAPKPTPIDLGQTFANFFDADYQRIAAVSRSA